MSNPKLSLKLGDLVQSIYTFEIEMLGMITRVGIMYRIEWYAPNGNFTSNYSRSATKMYRETYLEYRKNELGI
jgi:hypothetical protein